MESAADLIRRFLRLMEARQLEEEQLAAAAERSSDARVKAASAAPTKPTYKRFGRGEV